jgi:hypothetical protein
VNVSKILLGLSAAAWVAVPIAVIAEPDEVQVPATAITVVDTSIPVAPYQGQSPATQVEDYTPPVAPSKKPVASQKPTVHKTVKPKPRPTHTEETADTYYKNCAAVRAAGAAPIRRGDPGYSRKLDRDGDGVGCE